MAINFPATPTLNQTYTYNGRTWTYNGVGWQATGASGLSVYTKTTFTATAAQTTFSVTYTVGFVDVYYNGSKLSSSEYTATNGTSVVLGTACAVNDIVETIAWTVSTTLNPALGVATATSLAIGGATIGSNALAVTGTSTFSSTVTHSGATTLSGALTYGGVTLSNAVTGTGNMVLSASPTLTGTLTAAAANFSGAITAAGTGATLAATVSMNANTTGQPAYFSAGGTDTNVGIDLNTKGTGSLRLNVNSAVAVTVANGGLVGIGMTPSNVLDITQNQNGNSVVAILNSDGGASATTRYRLRNGTTTSEFQLFGSGFTPTGVYRANGLLVENSGAGGVTINAAAAQPIYFGINSVEKARIDTSGNLLVGTTTTGGWTTVAKLEVVAGTGNQALSGYNSGSSGNALVLRTDNDNSNLINFNRNGVAAGTFVSTGGGTPNIQWLANNQAYVIAGGSGGVTLASAATAWAAVSDETLKTDLAPIQSGAEKVGSLRAVTGRYKTDAESMSRSFLIAQDVQKVLPEAVSTDADGTLSLRYTEVVPLLVAAIQELTTRLAALEAK